MLVEVVLHLIDWLNTSITDTLTLHGRSCTETWWCFSSSSSFDQMHWRHNSCNTVVVFTSWMTDTDCHVESSTTSAVRITDRSRPTSCEYLFADYPATGSFLEAFNVIISVTGLSNWLPLASSEPKTFGTLNDSFNFMSYPTCALSVWYRAAFIVIIGAAGLESATTFGQRVGSESQTPLGKSPSH